MKKMVMTAFAVVAFSGAGMANTIQSEEKTEFIDNKNKEEDKSTIERDQACVNMMLDTYQLIMEIRNNGKEDWTLLNNLLSNC